MSGGARTRLWIIGRGGMLGRATEAAASDFDVWTGASLDWSSSELITDIHHVATQFLAEASSSDWAVAWCAGAGVVGTSMAVLEAETASLNAVLDALRMATATGTFFLASSAGGVFAGSSDRPIREGSAVAPLADYGRNKLVQEALVREWAASTGSRAVIGRIANLYGPGQSLDKAQGLISQVCLATLTRRPISIYVSLDTIRDYLFTDDCGGMVAGVLVQGASLESGLTVTKIFGSGQSVSIGGVLSEARRVLGRRPPIVLAASPHRRLQGSTLKFRSDVWIDLDRHASTTLPVGIHRVAEGIRSRLGSAALSSG